MSEAVSTAATKTGNLLVDFYDRLPAALAHSTAEIEPQPDPSAFRPGFALPELDTDIAEFLAAATARWQDIATYQGHRVILLDLTGNPGTHTTKTFASLLIVARAVEYIRRTGERIMIFSPTSGNKGIALRDAVLRAYRSRLVAPAQLQIAMLAPAGCLPKLRSTPMSQDAELRARNPLLAYTGDQPEDVKRLGKAFMQSRAADIKRRTGTNVWFSLELRNYLMADTTRAFFEHAVDPIEPGSAPRLHAHAVSSAFGLLGYHLGRSILEAGGEADVATRPASLLVQHLGTPDMVLNLHTGSFDRAGLPDYTPDGTGLFRQSSDPRFPFATLDPNEVLDPTFYTRLPATSPSMNEIIRRHGGDGIVVSLYECIERYAAVRAALADTPRPLPADFRTVREWSVVMALAGVFNAIDRGLIEPDRDIVVHGSGWYTTADYTPLPANEVTPVRTVEDIEAAVLT
jgi:hypothetical protein